MKDDVRSRENELFRRWREAWPESERASFVSDGVVHPETYAGTKFKILLMLKEVNGPEVRDLRDFLYSHGGRSYTWDTVSRWLRAIRRLPEELAWENIRDVTEDCRFTELQSIAAINLKKTHGAGKTNKELWWAAVNRDYKYIKEQFSFYNADLVICCGDIVETAFRDHIQTRNMPEWRETSRGVRYLEYEAKKYVISYVHPGALFRGNLKHYGLVDVVREIFGASAC